MNQFVLDCSVTMSWCFEDEKTVYSETILDLLSSGSKALVPSLWSYEVLNVLISAHRHKRMTEAQAIGFWQKLHAFSINIDGSREGNWYMDIMMLAHQYKLTSYDASYLELALRENCPLATLDANLKKAAHKAGVSLAHF